MKFFTTRQFLVLLALIMVQPTLAFAKDGNSGKGGGDDSRSEDGGDGDSDRDDDKDDSRDDKSDDNDDNRDDSGSDNDNDNDNDKDDSRDDNDRDDKDDNKDDSKDDNKDDSKDDDSDDAKDDDDNVGDDSGSNSGKDKKDGRQPSAGRKSEQDRALQAVRRGDAVPLQRVLSYSKANFEGKIIDVKLKQRKGKFHYEIRILTRSNFVRFIRLDAKSLKKI